MNTLLYLIYGAAEEFHLELTYSVLTAMAQRDNDDFRIILASEAHNHRDDLPVEHLPISSEELFDWTFEGRFNHGAKIGVLKKAAVCGGKVALVDTDTFFLRSPVEIFDRIDERDVVMHHDEGPLSRHGQLPAYRTLMGEYSGPYAFDESSHMFNSGVVGLTSSSAPLLDDVAQLTRDLLGLALAPLHTFEQFSFGLVLGTRRNIRTADDIVRHYTGWPRRFVHERIRERLPELARSAPEAVLAASHGIDVVAHRQAIDVVRAKLKAWRRRGLDEYALAYLCYLSALSVRARADANAWAATALDFITWNNYPRDVVASDFSGLRAERLAALDWLDLRVRDRWIAYWREVTTTSPAAP